MSCLPCFRKQKKYECEQVTERDRQDGETKTNEALTSEKKIGETGNINSNVVNEEPGSKHFIALNECTAIEDTSHTKTSPHSTAELKARFFQSNEIKEETISARAAQSQSTSPAMTSAPPPTPEPNPEIATKIVALKQELAVLEDDQVAEYCTSALVYIRSLHGQKLSDKMAADLNGIINRLETLVGRLEIVANRSEGGTSAEGDSPNVQAYDIFLNGRLKDYLNLSAKIGGEVHEQSKLVKVGFTTLRGVLVASSKYKQPSQDNLQKVFSPLSASVSDVQAYGEKQRNHKVLGNHMLTVKEAIPAIGWVAAPKPSTYVKEIKDQAMFYGNRVFKDFKGKDEQHVDWWRSLCATLTELEDFVKDYYSIGLTWNPKGGDYVQSAVGPPPPPRGGPAPPPPPPPVQAPTGAPAAKGADDQKARSELFATLNQGTDITKGLKKVTKDMQTHKNPTLRAGCTVPDKPTLAAKPTVKPAADVKKPPKCELTGKKWTVEYQTNNPELVISDTHQSQTVYIYKCENSTIQIKGKLNSIVLDGCSKTGVVVDDVISTVDFVNCQRVKGQIIGKVPCINIDKTDGIELYLSKDSLDSEIVMAKSSAMNILVPKDDDYVEFPLPEQFKASWNGSGFSTTVTESG